MKSETEGIVKRAGRWSRIWGILMFVCGILAISLPLAFSIGSVIVLAWLIPFAGIWHLIFAFHSHSIGSFLWKILLAVLYVVAGTYMLLNPYLRVESIVLVLAALFFLEGAMEIALYFSMRGSRHSGWVLFDGVVTLILGILIWRHWPSSSFEVLGTLVGISLMLSGIARFMLSSAAHHLSPTSA